MPITNNHVPTMQIDTPEKIFVAYDNKDCSTICATATMDETIRRVINYLYARDCVCSGFSYFEDYTVIEYAEMIRIGAQISEQRGSVIISATKFFKSDD